jgi:hypothetical protein
MTNVLPARLADLFGRINTRPRFDIHSLTLSSGTSGSTQPAAIHNPPTALLNCTDRRIRSAVHTPAAPFSDWANGSSRPCIHNRAANLPNGAGSPATAVHSLLDSGGSR